MWLDLSMGRRCREKLSAVGASHLDDDQCPPTGPGSQGVFLGGQVVTP